MAQGCSRRAGLWITKDEHAAGRCMRFISDAVTERHVETEPRICSDAERQGIHERSLQARDEHDVACGAIPITALWRRQNRQAFARKHRRPQPAERLAVQATDQFSRGAGALLHLQLEGLAVATATCGPQALVEPLDLLDRNTAGAHLAPVQRERAQLDVVGLVDRTMHDRCEIRGHCRIAHLILEERSIAKRALGDAGRGNMVLMAVGIGVRKDSGRLDAVPGGELAERADGLAIATQVAVHKPEEMDVVAWHAEHRARFNRLLPPLRGNGWHIFVGQDDQTHVEALGAQQRAGAAGADLDIVGVRAEK